MSLLLHTRCLLSIGRLFLKKDLLQCWSIAGVTFLKRACIISTGNKAGNLIKRELASVDSYEKQKHTERTKDRSLSDLEITHILIMGRILVNVNRTAPTSWPMIERIAPSYTEDVSVIVSTRGTKRNKIMVLDSLILPWTVNKDIEAMRI